MSWTKIFVCSAVAGFWAFSSPGAFAQGQESAAMVSPSTGQTKLERTREILKEQDRSKAGETSLPSEDLSGTAVRMFQGLLLCLGILALGVYVAKRFGIKPSIGAARRIKLLERTSLTGRTSLLLAEVEGKTVLLAVGPDPVSFLEVKDIALYEETLAQGKGEA